MRSGHSDKGHQNTSGKTIADGQYESDFDPDELRQTWLSTIKGHIRQAQVEVGRVKSLRSKFSYVDAMAALHSKQVQTFYLKAGGANEFYSFEICLVCLRELPEYALLCGHVLCKDCIVASGDENGPSEILMTRCPLHEREVVWNPPRSIIIKPKHAGVRILCLDGLVKLPNLCTARNKLLTYVRSAEVFEE